MSELDVITKGSGNPVSLIISGTFSDGSAIDLHALTDIDVDFGAETYSLANDPSIVVVESSVQLDLFLNATTETQSSHFDIKIFDSNYPRPLGYTITSACLGNLSRPKICG